MSSSLYILRNGRGYHGSAAHEIEKSRLDQLRLSGLKYRSTVYRTPRDEPAPSRQTRAHDGTHGISQEMHQHRLGAESSNFISRAPRVWFARTTYCDDCVVARVVASNDQNSNPTIDEICTMHTSVRARGCSYIQNVQTHTYHTYTQYYRCSAMLRVQKTEKTPIEG